MFHFLKTVTKIIFRVLCFFCLFKWYKHFECGESGDIQTAGLGSGSAGGTSVQTGVAVPSEVISQLFDLGAKKYINMLGSV